MRVLIPLPRCDFDPTEAAVSWQILAQAGHDVVFATPDGAVAHADPVMLDGIGLDYWSRVPGLKRLKLVGLALRADRHGRAAYSALLHNAAFLGPLSHAQLRGEDFDALLLPGGHAQGMREYLESAMLQQVVAGFFDAGKPVAAVCHGVVLAARSISPRNGKSVLCGRKTTALTWSLERSAWRLSRYAGRWWDRDYYRTYREQPGEPCGYRSVQAEVTRCLARPEDFLDVPAQAPFHLRKASGLFRDTPDDSRPAFIVRDGNYLSARWPGDVHTFAQMFSTMLAEHAKNR
ncbi:MAG: type 1 glutamine amidotransferase domain-containing protein [Rudaea sp.]|nr:type 1 glutamine amidotransferase domain-containing protein [Rudaea sp.]